MRGLSCYIVNGLLLSRDITYALICLAMRMIFIDNVCTRNC